jgi:hypothetical protein
MSGQQSLWQRAQDATPCGGLDGFASPSNYSSIAIFCGRDRPSLRPSTYCPLSTVAEVTEACNFLRVLDSIRSSRQQIPDDYHRQLADSLPSAVVPSSSTSIVEPRSSSTVWSFLSVSSSSISLSDTASSPRVTI